MKVLEPHWPASSHIRVATTLRGRSAEGLNLGLNTGDDPDRVMANRRLVRGELKLPSEPFWLKQVHGTRVLRADDTVDPAACDREADASFTDRPGVVCAVLTADCLPVVFAAKDDSKIAVAHAGWRGLAGGVLEATLAALDIEPSQLWTWLGPAIGQKHFEVGDEVREAFMAHDPAAAEAFAANDRGRWQADLYRLARRRLNRAGVLSVYGGGHCTFEEKQDFFSYRRNPCDGRMATLVWKLR